MERSMVGWLRGIVCLVMLAGLAACYDDGSSTGTSVPSGNGQMHGPGTAHIPPVVNPVEPPSNPGTPTEPEDSDDPVDTPDDTNTAPQIAGTPTGEVLVGQTFNFQPSATDADGDSLTFSIVGKPSWASFDSGTGRLFGAPSPADVGSHEQIVISVSDGGNQRSLPEFAVNVVAQANGNATLAWEPPTQNTDGSPLTNLKGYRIHYGTSAGAYDKTVTVNNAGVTSYVIENLSPGTYFFAISALSSNGMESDLSGEASKTI